MGFTLVRVICVLPIYYSNHNKAVYANVKLLLLQNFSNHVRLQCEVPIQDQNSTYSQLADIQNSHFDICVAANFHSNL